MANCRVRLEYRNGKPYLVSGVYVRNGRKVRLADKVGDGQSAKAALAAQASKAEKELVALPA